MRLEHADLATAKGWYAGPWNSELEISIGYANQGVDEPHLHTRITEIYLVARGNSSIRVDQQTVTLNAGDMLVLEPGEAHTFLHSSPDYFHFVIHAPGLQGEQARAEKMPISRVLLGLDSGQ